MTVTTAASESYDALLDTPGVMRQSWQALARRGVVVRLSLSRWRPAVRLTADDLGLATLAPEEEAQVDRVIKLGQALLVTPDTESDLRRAESAPRRVLEAYSYELLGGSLRFVPITSYKAWKEANDACERAWYAARDRLLLHWDDEGRALILVYWLAAQRAYVSLSKLSTEVSALGLETFCARYVQRMMALRPSPAAVAASFSYETQIELLDPAGSADGSVTGDPGVDADLQEAIARRRRRLADSFVTDVIAQLNTIIADVAAGVATGVQKNGYVPPSSVKSMTAMIGRAPLLNFYGDPDVDALVRHVRLIVETPVELRDPLVVAKVMRAVAEVARGKVREAKERAGGSRARAVSPIDAATEGEYRRARRDLGLLVEEDRAIQGRIGRRVDGSPSENGSAEVERRGRRAQ